MSAVLLIGLYWVIIGVVLTGLSLIGVALWLWFSERAESVVDDVYRLPGPVLYRVPDPLVLLDRALGRFPADLEAMAEELDELLAWEKRAI